MADKILPIPDSDQHWPVPDYSNFCENKSYWITKNVLWIENLKSFIDTLVKIKSMSGTTLWRTLC